MPRSIEKYNNYRYRVNTMAKIYSFIFIALIFLSVASSVSAKSSELFIDYLTKRVYEDCIGKDLHIKEPFIQDTRTNQSVTNVPWPYENLVVRRIIELLGNYEPWDFNQGTCDQKGIIMGGSKDGCDILTCGENELDINQFTYFWNDERVDIPREEFNTVYGDNIETYGGSSPVTTGDNSPINQNGNSFLAQIFWSKGTIGGLLIGAVLWIAKRIVYDMWKKFKKKKLIVKKESK